MEDVKPIAPLIFIAIREEDFDTKLKTIVEGALKRVLADKEPAKYYGIQEAAKYTGKALSTLYTDHCRGRLKAFKSGRHLRFTEQQLIEYLEGR